MEGNEEWKGRVDQLSCKNLIDEDVLLAFKEIAKKTGVSIGKALSDLARRALSHQPEILTRNGVPLFPRQSGAKTVTLELVNQLRDETR